MPASALGNLIYSGHAPTLQEPEKIIQLYDFFNQVSLEPITSTVNIVCASATNIDCLFQVLQIIGISG